jgi:hypothetical protein
LHMPSVIDYLEGSRSGRRSLSTHPQNQTIAECLAHGNIFYSASHNSHVWTLLLLIRA